jgi:hypothetical protein
MINSNLDSQKELLEFLDSQIKLSEKINKIELNYICMIKDINTAITYTIVKNLKGDKNKQIFDSDINQIKLNSIKAFTDLYHDIVKELSDEQ